METRFLKVSFGKAGNGGIVNRITIPTKWVKQMRLEKGENIVIVNFDGKTISIEKAGE